MQSVSDSSDLNNVLKLDAFLIIYLFIFDWLKSDVFAWGARILFVEAGNSRFVLFGMCLLFLFFVLFLSQHSWHYCKAKPLNLDFREIWNAETSFKTITIEGSVARSANNKPGRMRE